MKLILKKRMYLNGAYREPGEYQIGRVISHTDAKCAVADSCGVIVADTPKIKTDAPENKQLANAPENKATLESGDSGSAGTIVDAGDSGQNPMLPGPGSGGGRKRRMSKNSQR